MEIRLLVSKYMQARIFTAAELVEAADPADLPPSVQYCMQSQAGDPIKSMGVLLSRAPGVESVGTRRRTKLWRAEA